MDPIKILFAIFVIGISPLKGRPVTISEINFDRREFVEFYNHSDTPIDLTGYTVIGGIDAFLVGIIPPKEYAVIVGDTSDFRRVYGNSPKILAEFERILDNDGEEIALRDPAGTVVLRINYRIPQRGRLTVRDNWPPDLFINEHPLEFNFPDNLELNQSDGPNWRRAYRKEGTPGRGSDTDLDGLDDEWERYRISAPEPLAPLASDDPDDDGLDNFTEQLWGTSPTSADTDRDGLIDSFETATGYFVSPTNTGTNPLVADTDNDGLSDGWEIPIDTPEGAYATDPHIPDSDGDSHRDGAEVRYLGDPTDPTIAPRPPVIEFFHPDFDEVRAGQPIALNWEIKGSGTQTLSPLPEHRTSIQSSGADYFSPTRRTVLLASGLRWQRDSSDTDFGNAWSQPDFDDSAWLPINTPGCEHDLNGDPVTPYYRTTVQLPALLLGNRLECIWTHSGGSALHFNGQLVKKFFLPTEFTRSTLANHSDSYAIIETTFSPPPFSGGPLTIAAENHLDFFDPSCFDLSLSRLDPITGLQTYTLSATNPYGTVEKTIDVTILDDLPPLQTYEHWALESLPNEDPELNREEDPDHDGIPNILEFLTGSSPLVHNENPLSIESVFYQPPSFPWLLDRFAWFEFSFLRHRNPSNVGLRFEESSDLINWTTLPTNFNPSSPHSPAIQVIDDQVEKLTYRIYKNRKPKFFRLKSLTAN